MTDIVPGLPAPPAELAFLLDIDGTILDIAPTPSGVRVSSSLRETLARLDRLSGDALALVSGRSLQDIDRVFAPLRLAAIGGHGAELRPAKEKAPVAGRAPALPADLRQRLAGLAALGSGIIVEDKGYSLALHYRLAPDLKDAVENVKGWAAIFIGAPPPVAEEMRRRPREFAPCIWQRYGAARPPAP